MQHATERFSNPCFSEMAGSDGGTWENRERWTSGPVYIGGLNIVIDVDSWKHWFSCGRSMGFIKSQSWWWWSSRKWVCVLSLYNGCLSQPRVFQRFCERRRLFYSVNNFSYIVCPDAKREVPVVGRVDGSVPWVLDSWFRLGSWPWGPGMEAWVGSAGSLLEVLCLPQSLLFVLSLSLKVNGYSF